MSQFSIHALRSEEALVCRIQTDLGAETPYLLCAPVVARAAWGAPIPLLHVPVSHDGEAHLILMSQMVALPSRDLSRIVGTAAEQRDAILKAIDLLVLGF